jgi:hypothetical protein
MANSLLLGIAALHFANRIYSSVALLPDSCSLEILQFRRGLKMLVANQEFTLQENHDDCKNRLQALIARTDTEDCNILGSVQH